MDTGDTGLSGPSKMGPGPEQRLAPPGAPDKNLDSASESVEEAVNVTVIGSSAAAKEEGCEGNAPSNNSCENKQEEPATLSTLNEGELRALLDEALTYKCPKDREGKSNLFKELLQEAETDETEEGRRAAANSRCLPGSNRRRHKRDSVSERLTHGGSLQNLAQPLTSEFDSSFAYLNSGSSHTYGGGRRKGKKHSGPSVSARQREGGSLPSNVNASHSLASLANLDLLFDKKGFSEERTSYDWASKEKSKSLDKPSYSGSKRDDKDKREGCGGAQGEGDNEARERKGARAKQGTNEMVESDPPPPEPKPDYMVIDLGDVEVGGIAEHNVAGAAGAAQRTSSLDPEDSEGTEMKIIEPRRPVQFITRATFDIAQTPVDTTIEFPIREHNGKSDKSKVSVNGTEATGALPYQTYNSVKCVIGGTSGGSSTQQGTVLVPRSSSGYSVLPMPIPWNSPNITMEPVSRVPAHHSTLKESSSSGEKKSLDENGNAVQGYNGERKKTRRKHTQEPNVIVYSAENVEGHRNEDIDSLINFIENKDSKGKKSKTSNTVRVKTSSGTKPRARDKDAKREQLPAKLHKSNSLEEISKTKLEDLTAEKSSSSSGASSISSQHGTTSVALRRAKQRSTGDTTVDCRGDRRSWGTEEGQSIYCNDTGDDYSTRRNSGRKVNPEPEPEPDFLVVTKKKKSKKQRRSSSGSRAQNLANSGSYLQRSRGFNNEYRTPLSPELRRKSASSMPPSDKSDSSDLDSVHSLPVTSNTNKHNLTKNAAPSSGTPQASYADIARMATINISPSSALNTSPPVPNVLNTSSWPSVPAKAPSEPDKLPQDYYPSLDELQQTDRKTRQHNFAHSNNVNSLSLSFEKPPSPTNLTKSSLKSSPDSKKAEAREEAINKNMQVFKYVQDIEKMHQSLAQQHKNNPGLISNEMTPANQTPPRIAGFGSPDCDNNNPQEQPVNFRDVNARNNNPRSRRGHQQNLQNSQYDDVRKSLNPGSEDGVKKVLMLNEEKEPKRQGNPGFGAQEDAENTRPRVQGNPKSGQVQSNAEVERSSSKTERNPRSPKDQQQPAKSGNPQNQNCNRQQEQSDDGEGKRSKLNSARNNQKVSEGQTASSRRPLPTSRPAVILMDETASDNSRNSDSPSELTFGFEINEQLLLSDDSEETPTASPVFSPGAPPIFDKPPPNFDRPPPMFDKHLRYDKPPPNFHHMHPPHGHLHHRHVMVPPLPYIAYPPRFHPPPTYLPPPPPPPPGIVDKYHQQPKEDFSARYVAPEESVNVQNYNHDKIVNFVGLAWDDVMREMPVTTVGGRVQYYSGQ